MSNKFIWYGHATLGLETDGYKLVIDPFFEGNPAASTTHEAVEVDYILVSHGHGDHVGDTSKIAKRTGATIITNAEIAGWCGHLGLKTHAQHIGGGYKHPFGYLKFTIAVHGSELPDGASGGNPVGFLLTTNDGRKIYMAQDTGLFSEMKLLGEEGIDLAILPIGDNYTMGPDDALKAVKLLAPKLAVPCHYNTWPPIEQDGDAWVARVNAETDAKAQVLAPGESFDLF